jgi:hypothetical protein
MNAQAYALFWLERLHAGSAGPVAIQPAGGTFAGPVDVTLSCATPGVTIRYTLDGAAPDERSPEYRGGLRLERGGTLRAAAFGADVKAGPVAAAAFVLGGPAVPRTGLELWLKTDAGVTAEEGALVGWSDQSGNGRHAEGVAATAPRLVTNKTGGPPLLVGERGKFLRLRRLVPLPGDCTLVFLAAITGPASAVVGDGDDGWIGMDDLARGRLHARFSVGEPAVRPQLRDGYTSGRVAVWTVVRQGNRVVVYRDGKPAAVPDTLTSRGTTLNLGLLLGMRPAVQNLKGELAELLVYGAAIPGEERAAVEQYLGDKYGLGTGN